MAKTKRAAPGPGDGKAWLKRTRRLDGVGGRKRGAGGVSPGSGTKVAGAKPGAKAERAGLKKIEVTRKNLASQGAIPKARRAFALYFAHEFAANRARQIFNSRGERVALMKSIGASWRALGEEGQAEWKRLSVKEFEAQRAAKQALVQPPKTNVKIARRQRYLAGASPAAARSADAADDQRRVPGDDDQGSDPGVGTAFLAKGFRITARVGQGTFGSVYQVQDVTDGRMHAAKVFQSEVDAREEAEVYGALAQWAPPHPSFAEMLFNGVSCVPAAFIVLPLMPDSLAAVIKQNGAINQGEGLAILEQVRGGLQHLHEKAGWLHMDVKPANILYRAATRHAVIVDFSLAEQWPQPKGVPRKYGQHGTAPYRAPELWGDAVAPPAGGVSPAGPAGGVSPVGPAGDAWALGCVAFEMASGMKFFSSEMAPTTRRAERSSDVYHRAIMAYCAERSATRGGPWTGRACRNWPMCRDIVWQLLHPTVSKRLGLDGAAWEALTL